MAIELAMLAPAMLFLLALIFVYGKAAGVSGALESGTRDAARSATLSRSYLEAQMRAEDIMKSALRQAPPECRDGVKVQVLGEFEPDGMVRVEASCSYDISTLGLPGAPGKLTAESTFYSRIDPYRGMDQ